MKEKSIRQVTGAAFVSVLLGFVLKNLIDTFIPHTLPNGIVPIAQAVIAGGWVSSIVAAQLGIFLFTLVRFYLGSVRYHEEEPEPSGSASELIIDLIGVIGVFLSFYIASVVIKTTNLFYAAFGLITLVDLAWFWIAKEYSGLSKGMEAVARWYVRFDIITLVGLIGFFAVEERWGPGPLYLPQWLALAVLCLIGCWDLTKLWPFYSGAPEWQKQLLESRKGRRR